MPGREPRRSWRTCWRWTLGPTCSSCPATSPTTDCPTSTPWRAPSWTRWPGPQLVGTGNHDVREAFARGLLDAEAAPDPLVQVLEAADFRILMLDSLVPAPPGQRIDHGELSRDQLDWLDDQLSSDDRPAFVSLHHPPGDIGVGLMAPILLRQPESLEQVLMKHPHVIATLVGHAHTACATTFAGRPLLIGGGCASTVPLDNEPYPVIWEAGPPTLAFHLLHDDLRLTTHWRALPFPGGAG